MVFYIHYEGKTWIKNKNGENFSELLKSIKSNFKLGSFELKYLDTDDEQINLDSQEEFEWMLEELSQLNISEIQLYVADVLHSKQQTNENIEIQENEIIESNTNIIIEKNSSKHLEEENASNLEEIEEIGQKLIDLDPQEKSKNISEINEYEIKQEELKDERKLFDDEIKEIIRETFEKEFLLPLTQNISKKIFIVKHKNSIETNLNSLKKEDQEQECLQKKIIHENSVCFLCKTTPITGIKFKCPICIDREYCSFCEVDLYHEHDLLKIKNIPKQKKNEESIQKPENYINLEQNSEKFEEAKKIDADKKEIEHKKNSQSENNLESITCQERLSFSHLSREKGAEFFLNFGEIEIIPKKFDISHEEIVIKFQIFNESDRYLENKVFVRLSPLSYLKGDVVEVGKIKEKEMKRFEMKLMNPKATGKYVFSLQIFEIDNQSELILKESSSTNEFQIAEPVVETQIEKETIAKAILLNECCFNDQKNINDCVELVLENKDLDANQLIEKFLNLK